MTAGKLAEQQRAFTLNAAKLIIWAYDNGYELTFGDAYRSPECAALNARRGSGIANSLHTQRLAIDFNLFRDQRYLALSLDHAQLGAHWKSLHALNRWGGDFTRADGNHYSMAYGGLQ